MRKRGVIVKKLSKKLGIATLVVCLMTGCGNPLKKMTSSTVYIQKNGKVQSLSVESFDKEYYKEEDLKAFIDKEIEEQQKERSEDSVSIKEFKVKEEKATLQLQFAGIDDYQAFTDTEIENGTYTKEIANEKEIKELISRETNEKQEISQIEPSENLNYIYLKDPEGIQILFDTKVQYCSENVTILDENFVRIPADELCFIVYEGNK